MIKPKNIQKKYSENEKKLDWPTISFAIATFNSDRTIKECLSSIRFQDYPSEIEVILGDGGSNDNTLKLARQYKARVIEIPKEKQDAEYNKGVAVKNSKNELLIMIDHDNILPHRNWLKEMVQPLLEDDEIIGSGVLRFKYVRSMTLLDRYFALIGATDPVALFFNKSAHQSYLYDGFHLKGRLIDEREKYFVVELNPDNLPALGGNGAVLRRELLKRANSDPDNFFHIDIHVDLARLGLNKYAFVKESVIHLTNNKLIPFLKRRQYYIEKYYFQDFSKRRYSIYEPKKDKFLLFLYILYSLSVIFPTLHAVKGYLKVRDFAWFIHPLMCLGMLTVYAYPTLREEIKRVLLAK